jgi:hypothetical protein
VPVKQRFIFSPRCVHGQFWRTHLIDPSWSHSSQKAA